MKFKLFFVLGLQLIFFVGISQTDTTKFACNNCANPLFTKSVIIKTNKKYIFIKYDKTPNKLRDSSKVKDVHCVYCNSHIGYCEKKGEVKILSKAIDKTNNEYECSVCKKTILKVKELKNKKEGIYHFTVKNAKNIEIANRSFIIHNKNVYCGFCYEFVGIKKKNGVLKIRKDKIL